MLTHYIIFESVIIIVVIFQAFENLKRVQIEKFHSLPPEQQADFEIKDPNEIFKEAIKNIKPILVLNAIKRGGVRYQVINF